MSDTFADLPRDSRGIVVGLWTRRAVMAVFAVVFVLALSARFGQTPQETATRAPAASMTLSAPSTVRGGLLFQSRLDIRATQAIDHPRLVLADGWLEGMQVNSIEPAPVGEASRDGRVIFSYDAMKPGDRLRVWLQFQVNPTNVGHRSYVVELDDAERPVTRIDRKITILP